MADDKPLIGRYMVQADVLGNIPVERRIFRIDNLSGFIESPYRATHVETMRSVIVQDNFEREATKEESDAAKRRIGEFIGDMEAIADGTTEGEEGGDAANAETLESPQMEDVEMTESQ